MCVYLHCNRVYQVSKVKILSTKTANDAEYENYSMFKQCKLTEQFFSMT